jgi:hypothetical protein
LNGPQPLSKKKLVIAGLMVAWLVLMLVLLQSRYDQGDHKSALKLIASRAPGATWSVWDEMLARAGDESIACTPRIVSSFQGTIDVSCQTGKAGTYQFSVDLVRKLVLPVDEKTKELVATAQAKAKAPSTPAKTPHADADAGG